MLKVFDLAAQKVGYEVKYNANMIPQVISEFQGSAGRAAHSMNLGTVMYESLSKSQNSDLSRWSL